MFISGVRQSDSIIHIHISIHTLLYITQIINKDLLYSTGNSIQYSVIPYMCKESSLLLLASPEPFRQSSSQTSSRDTSGLAPSFRSHIPCIYPRSITAHSLLSTLSWLCHHANLLLRQHWDREVCGHNHREYTSARFGGSWSSPPLTWRKRGEALLCLVSKEILTLNSLAPSELYIYIYEYI